MGVRWAWAVLAAGLVGLAAGCSPKPTPTTAPAPPAPDPDLQGPDLFEDLTRTCGIDFAYRNGEDDGHLAILESLGGGVALIDYDRDGLLDVYIPGGGYYDGPDKHEIKGHPGRLYRNLGDFKFKDVTKEAGLDALAGGAPWFYTHAATVFDYDRDGWPDLLVTGWGRVALFHNEADPKSRTGGRRFVDVSHKAGLDKGVTWATSAAAADFDGDGYPDLYVCQYVDWSFANHPTDCNYDGHTRDVCPPKNFSGLPHKVYRNNRDGTFTDVSDEAGLRKGGPNASKGLGVLAVDVNGDGKPDVYVANDTVDNFLYLNRSKPGQIRFEEVGGLAGVARDGHGNADGSMGVDAGDPDGTGKPYLWVTNYEKELHALYKNESTKDDLLFLFHTPASGIAAIGQAFVGWGTGFFDWDHDGWEDIFIANGHAIRYPSGAARYQKPVLLRNTGGKFKDLTPRGGEYFRAPHLARGVALGDLDNDGRVDIVVSHINQPVAVLKNVAPTAGSHWLGVELARKDRGDVVGARLVLEAGGRKQSRFAKGGGSYASAPDRRFVWGLGPADKVERLTVTWPDGTEQTWADLKVDRYHRLTQGEKESREPGRD
jgi:enediyne biosynthesis protein E4